MRSDILVFNKSLLQGMGFHESFVQLIDLSVQVVEILVDLPNHLIIANLGLLLCIQGSDD